MNHEEIKEAFENDRIVINERGMEIKISAIGVKHYFVTMQSVDTDEMIYFLNDRICKWRLKPVKKKYWIWKYRKTSDSTLMTTDLYLDDDFETTAGATLNWLEDIVCSGSIWSHGYPCGEYK